MVNAIKNKIEAHDRSIGLLLRNQKFSIDYFQREYRWQEKHISVLIEDLTNTFLQSFRAEDKRSAVANYQNYYLGPVVLSVDSETGKKSIIDGQQRITSLTLFLIFLNHLQKASNQKVAIENLIFSEKFGEKSFNMSDEIRENCISALFEFGEYTIADEDNETILNMVDRFCDIEKSFPDELTQTPLPYFIDWLIENVIVVEITAYSDENAYTIFETMNDRGLNLSPTEMLKGFILSKITDKKQRSEVNEIWKNQIQQLHEYSENADQSFFQAWFRAKYALKIRPGQAGSENQDFELIGTRFHSWFKENCHDIIGLRTSDDFTNFIRNDFLYYSKKYMLILNSYSDYAEETRHIFYVSRWGIAGSLQEPIILSAVSFADPDYIVLKKMDLCAKYIETFTVRRAVNFRKFGQASIKYTMFNIIKLFRNNSLEELKESVVSAMNDIEQEWDAIFDFVLHGQNKSFIKHLLSRISNHVDILVGKTTTYANYFCPRGRQFEIEHIWADKFTEHLDEFEQEGDFQDWRNSIGALILLPNGTNQSFSSDKYEDKVDHYLKENTFAQSLNKNFYVKNPNFLNSPIVQQLKFKPHEHFKKSDIKDRIYLVQRICEDIWSLESVTT